MICDFLLRPQAPGDAAAIETLHARVFGPGRFARTAYRIREASTAQPLVALTAWKDDALAGAIHLTAVTVGGRRGAALLGPLAIAPAWQNKGCGLRLITGGMEKAGAKGCALVILVGDLPYYARAGFRSIPQGQITLPGPANPARFLAAELVPGTLGGFQGMVAADNEPLAAAMPEAPEPPWFTNRQDWPEARARA